SGGRARYTERDDPALGGCRLRRAFVRPNLTGARWPEPAPRALGSKARARRAHRLSDGNVHARGIGVLGASAEPTRVEAASTRRTRSLRSLRPRQTLTRPEPLTADHSRPEAEPAGYGCSLGRLALHSLASACRRASSRSSRRATSRAPCLRLRASS